MADKPKVLILGGCGFVGRNLVHFLVTNNLTSKIRVVDKTPPQMAWLNADHAAAFDNTTIVEFFSSNLINPASCKNAFSPTDSGDWNIVVNCAAETRPNQSDAVYLEGIYKLSMNCANEAANIRAERYIELSSGNMSSSDKSPAKENAKDAWTQMAKYKLKIESDLPSITNLNYTILRLPIVYGLGDKRGLVPRILIASLYKSLGEPMKLLWNEELKLNTIHVFDAVNAIWELSTNSKSLGETINLVDDSESTQGSISEILADIFGIKVDYWGVVLSSITKMNMSDVISEINDKHMGPWATICQKDGILNTPLTPYMDEEQLYHKHINLDNSKLKSLGYVLRYPKLTAEKIEEIINDYIKQNLYPKSLLM